MGGSLTILATSSMKNYAEQTIEKLAKIVAHNPSKAIDLGEITGKLHCIKFADGEIEVEVLDSLRGKDVFLLGCSSRSAGGTSAEENKIELYHTVDAIMRSAPATLTLIEPYFSASRSDRTTRRNSVGFWIHSKTLVALGVNHIITFQLHSDKSKTAIDPVLCSFDDIPTSALIQGYIARNFIKTPDVLENTVQKEWVFCSVDAGGEGLAKKYANAFGAPLIVAHKQRDYQKTNMVESVKILSDSNIEGKTVWIIDDMIDTAGSVFTLIEALAAKKVAQICVAITHGIFSPPAIERLKDLQKRKLLGKLLCTDSNKLDPELLHELPCLEIIESTGLCAEVIYRIHNKLSLSPLFRGFSVGDFYATLSLF